MPLEKYSLRNRMTLKFKQLIQSILGQQKNPPAILFFVLYVYRHNYPSFEDQQLTIFSISILFYLMFSFNMFYFFNPLFGNPVLSVINLALGIISTNQKWKMYLFVFVIGDSLNITYEEPIRLYTFLAAFYMCLQTYSHLIFQNISDCKVYFAGFFSIMIFELCSFAQEQFQMTQKISYSSVLFSILAAYFILNQRLIQIRNIDENNIKDARIFNHRINLNLEDLQKTYLKNEILQNHKKKCQNLNCFCKKESNVKQQNNKFQRIKYKTLQQFYLARTFYEAGIKLRIQNNFILMGQFINFLVVNGQISQAIFVYSQNQIQTKTFSLYDRIQKARLRYKIKQEIRGFDYQNIYSKQFEYVFTYDKVYLELAHQIKQILKLKHDFWMETAKEQSLMIKLQKIGSQIVRRMFNLNDFYHMYIAQIQNKVKTYNGTMLYAMYLLSTTNYKQFAEILIKNTSRNLQSIKIHQANNSQLFGLKISLRAKKSSFNQKVFENFQFQAQRLINIHQNLNLNPRVNKQQQQEQINEVITNISGSFCKLLNSSKSQILGSNISLIIPSLYRKKHHQKIKKLIGVRINENQVYKLMFLNKVRQIQFRTMNGRLINGKVAIKIFNQFNRQISFVSAVSITQSNNSTIIVSLEGVAYEFQQNLKNINLIKHQKIFQTIESLKNQWKCYKSISPTKKMLTFEHNHYTLQFSSPYQQSYLNQKAGEQQQPPIHIEIVSQQVGRIQNIVNLKTKEANICLQKIQQKFCLDQNSSQTSSGTRKSSIVNVLTIFSQGYFIPFYGYIMGLFFFTLLTCLLVIGLGSTNINLTWDNSKIEQNPIANLYEVSNLNLPLVRAINHIYDYQEYISNKALNKTLIDFYYGENYINYYLEQLKRNFREYNDSIISFNMDQSSVFASTNQQIINLKIPIFNPLQPNPQLGLQFLSIQDIFINFQVDLYQLSMGKPYGMTILSFNYWGFFTGNSPGQIFGLIVKQSIQQTNKLIMIFLAIVCSIIPLTIIPLFIIFKERVKKHVKIYDLVVSIQGQLISQQLKKIQNIIQIVVHANQASQVLKTNTQQYEARKRSSIIIHNHQGKNQMIQGLLSSKQKHLQDQIFQQSSNQLELKKQKTQQSQQSSFKVRTQNNFKAANRFFTSKTAQFRKRGGQLNLEKSEADPKRPLIKNWIIYFLVLSTLYFLISIALLKMNNFNNINPYIDQVNQITDHTLNQSLLLLNSKLFFRGTKPPSAYFNGGTLIDWLTNEIYSNQDLLEGDGYDQSVQYTNCSNMNNFKFCQQNYSIADLRYQLNQIIKNSFETKLIINQQNNLTANNFTSTQYSQIKSFSQLFFYAQTIEDRIQNVTLGYAEQLIQNMLDQNKQMLSNVDNYLVSGVIWGFLSFILGLCIINYMKKDYLQEIMIVSFLNTQMIMKNKRVQSFLQNLSKSGY